MTLSNPRAHRHWILATGIGLALAGCAPIGKTREALVCTAPDGTGFKTVLNSAQDYATLRPLRGTAVSILKMEETADASTLRNGYGVVAVVDRSSRTATVRSRPLSAAGPLACIPDPSPPQAIPEARRV